MPRTYWTFILGTLALIGIFPFAGFFSKDEILASMRYAGGHGQAVANFILVLGVAGAFITAFYMTRAVALTFHGAYKGHAHPHESPAMMTLPLMGLAFFAVTAGWVNIPGVYTGFTEWLRTRVPLIEFDFHHAESFDWPLLAVVTPLALVGIGIGWWLYGKDKDTQAERDSFSIPVLWPLFDNLYYINDFYSAAIVRPTMGPIARVVLWFDVNVIDLVVNAMGGGAVQVASAVRVTDENVVDGFYNATGALTEGSGSILRRTFTGRVQQYAAFSFVGVIVIAVLFIVL
jgi:NADH-quinone oxidoreductase subunit L